jgi:RNA polymerase sigma factor (sigma-70 family)
MKTPVVFVVDDDLSIRRSLTRLISSAGYLIETFASAKEFLNRDHYNGPGCLLLDIQMPGLDGLRLQEELTLAGYFIPIIFITGHATIPMSVKAMKGGAVDLLTKPFTEDQLLEAIKNALEKDDQKRTEYSEIQEIKNRMNTLSPREFDVFKLVVQGLLNKQIGFELGISEKTVKVHRARAMEKMRAGSLAELVHLAEKAGLTSIHNPIK